ncbi:MAG: TrkA C-terminal domain-containing protein [Acetanaerobacterium sp.]
MGNKIVPPVYSQIALDIAIRIVRGDLKENTKVYGRSVLSSEYGVSPETVRRAMRLLEDMKIVEIRQNSGALILSAENARQYVQRFGQQNDIRARQKKLDELLDQQKELGYRIAEVAGSIVRINETFLQTTPFPNYEAEIKQDSAVIGQTLGELKFWHQTAATVIAIRREDRIILSPGPYAALRAGDIIIFVGDVNSVEAVNACLYQ